MDESLLGKLQTIDPAILTDIVRQDQNNPAFEITEWNVKPLSDKGIMNPDGLWLINGLGSDGNIVRPWSVVLKKLTKPQEESPLDHLWYWKREFLFAQSGLAENLPGQVKAPRYYHFEETIDSAWVWMEHIKDRYPGKWALDEYAFAARQMGQWNSMYLNGKSLPTFGWLTRQPYRSWLVEMNIDEAWQFPLNQKYISEETRKRYMTLWNEREMFFKVLESLPQVFSHFDSQRRNLFIRQDETQHNELVITDWAQCGIGAIGAELNWMVGMGGFLLEWKPSDLGKLDEIVFKNYVQGLQIGGWIGDIDIARLGYVAMLAVFSGCALPSLVTFWCSHENQDFAFQILGLSEESLFIETLPVLNYALDCADEAQTLMRKMGFS